MIPLLEKAHFAPLTEMEQNILTYFENNLSSAVYMNLEDCHGSFIPPMLRLSDFVKSWG